jgi:ribose transport system permease protein
LTAVTNVAPDVSRAARTSRRPPSFWLDLLFVPGVVLVLVLYLSATSEVFATQGNLTNLLNQMVLLMLVATGSTFIILARELDLSIGGGVALTSVVAATVMVDTESVWAGLGAGLLAGVGLGLVNGLLVTRIEVPAFIATLGTAVIARGVAISMTDGGIVTGLPSGFIKAATGSFLGLSYIVWLMIVTVAVLLFVQTQTTFGYRVFAVGGNPEAARLAGIPVLRVKLICFLIGGATITLAGLAMLARVQSGQPNGATSLELYAIAAIVMGGTSLFGGRGSVLRTISGVLLIVILQNGLDLYGVGYDKQQIVIGVVFISAASVDFVRRKLDRNATRKTARRTSGVTSSSENA